MFVGFCREKYLLAIAKYIISARPHCVQVKHLMKINELAPYHDTKKAAADAEYRHVHEEDCNSQAEVV